MSLSLSSPTRTAEVQHKLAHDLESLFLVFLHIMRFLSSPRGDIESDRNREKTHHISRWHHEPSEKIMFSDKKSDLLEIYIDPETYITQYWRPVAPYLKELFEAVYPDLSFIHRNYDSPITPSTFVSILMKARNHCQDLFETKVNYAEINMAPPSKKRPSTALATEQKAKKPRKTQKRQTVRADPPPNPRRTRVGRFSNWDNSVAT